MSKVIKREITIKDAKQILENEKRFVSIIPTQEVNESAFNKALRGSQCFLKHKRLI